MREDALGDDAATGAPKRGSRGDARLQALRGGAGARTTTSPEEEPMTIKHKIRVDLYRIVADAVDAGVAYGTMRAFKHTNTPSTEAIEDAVSNAVMNELCDVLMFDEATDTATTSAAESDSFTHVD